MNQHSRALSYGQARMWTLDRIEGGTAGYNMPGAFRLRGDFDVDAFGLALKDVVLRHEPLRTIVIDGETGPIGCLRDVEQDEALFYFEDLTALTGSILQATIKARIETEVSRVFDLSKELMLRSRVLSIGPSEYVLIFVMHHIAGDGLSMPVLVRELGVAYATRLLGEAPVFKSLAVSYSDYASWQRRWLEESGELKRQLAYWREALSSAPEILSLPTDKSRRSDRSRKAGYFPIQIDSKTAKALETLAQSHRTTLFAVLMGLYGSLLGR